MISQNTLQNTCLHFEHVHTGQGCGVGSLVIRLRFLGISIIQFRFRLRPDSDFQLY